MFLTEIIELKKKRLEISKKEVDFSELKIRAVARREKAENHRLRKRLQSNQINIIAEIKRASPSKGIINNRIDVAETAQKYERGGACAISILTEEDKFQGSLNDLRTARKAVGIPLLRKDFIFDEYQIYEAAEAGADVILLIAAMLNDKNLATLHILAEEILGLDALIEVHTLEELERVKELKAKIIGINNRDLHTFKVSLDVSRELVKHAPENALIITESGISTKEEILELRKLGFSGFLIGETLMRSGDIEKELKKFTAEDAKRAEKVLNNFS